MNLREYLRNEFSMYIRSRLVKDECEWCGETKDLHFHHIDRFHNLLNDTLEELNLNELNTDEYSSNELNLISSLMLAKQIRSEYKTLCKSCHYKLHAIEKNSDEYKINYKNPFGSFIYFDYSLFNYYDGCTLIKFIKICCNATYDNFVLCGYDKVNNRKRANKMKDISDILGKNCEGRMRQEIKYLFDNKLLFKTKEGIKINDSVCSRNKKLKTNTEVKIFINSFKNLYDTDNNFKSSHFVNLFNMLPLLNKKYNVLCSDVESRDSEAIPYIIKLDMKKAINLSVSTIDRTLNKLSEVKLIDGNYLVRSVRLNGNVYYCINPALLYKGYFTQDILDCYNLINSDNISEVYK